MTTTEDYSSIADAVYNVDPLKLDPPFCAGKRFNTANDPEKQLWEIIEVPDNPSNGFQAMAAVPVVNGVKDYSRVSIAYAGTNFDDVHDVFTDVGVVLATKPAQAEAAMAFADKVKKKVTKHHPGATFETVGHSLGGYLAQYVAAEHRWAGTSFNGPDAWRIMSPETRAWLDKQNAAGTNPIKNWVNRFDVVGNAKGNRSGTAIFVDDVLNRPLPDYHNLVDYPTGKHAAFRFDASGNIVGAGAQQVDFGVILYNLGLTGPAEAIWSMDKSSPYPKVLVAMQPAIDLANRIGGLTEKLQAIKSANKGIESMMATALDEAKREYPASHPFVSHADVENCVVLHALEAHDNIDRNAVESVNRLVDHQLTMVRALHDGIHNVVVNAMTQDAQSAKTFGTK